MLPVQVGDKVVCIPTGVRGRVVKQYYPTASAQQTMIRTENGLLYHAPTYDFRKEEENESVCDTVSGPLAEHLQSIARGLQDALRGPDFLREETRYGRKAK